ncbi:hypothetical protein B0H39_004909 [Clostridium beijerinckii]|uniref:hypothetical protein n=1 Tax=Clostridium beijerinckii TaxID=1520 RepID=UPI001494322A|nr:hypothetical protein [Clostridium beijerinckii]NOW87028.1 hypothetical protein [Clostridium beijerinckii]
MNKKKIILSLLGFGVCLISNNAINIHASAETIGEPIDANFELPGQDEYDQIDFGDSQSSNRYDPRPDSGQFYPNTIHKGNPEGFGAYVSTFSDLSNHYVQKAMRTDYDFDMLFYIPTDFEYDSPGYAVPENKYAKFNPSDDFNTGWKDYYYVKKHGYYEDKKYYMTSHFNPNWSKWIYESDKKKDKDGDIIYNFEGQRWKWSTSNSSNVAIQPNTSNNHEGTKAKWYDNRFDRNLEWRYIGYSQQGVPLGNPYFPSDSDSGGEGFDRGYKGFKC